MRLAIREEQQDVKEATFSWKNLASNIQLIDTQTFEHLLNNIFTTNFSKIRPYKISERTFRNRLRDLFEHIFAFFV